MGAWTVHGIIHLNTNKVDLLSMSSDSKSMIHIQYQSFVDNVTDSHSISVIHIQCQWFIFIATDSYSISVIQYQCH